MDSKILEILQKYFEKKEEVVFAFLFGSASRDNIRKEGDIDIAVYFLPEKGIEWEVFGKGYKEEGRIALELEKLLKKEVDLIVLNKAKAILADEILRKGIPIIVKDRGILMEFLCIITDEAEYVRDWFATYYKGRILATRR